jgi:hypothetical protein
VPHIVLHIPSVQENLARRAGAELSRQWNVPVNVGRVSIEWLSRLAIRDVSVDDENGERLFEASHFSVGFKLLPLLQKKWIFTTVRLFDFSLHLKKETPDSALNLQFLLDAFASKDTTSSPNIHLQLRSVLFRHGEISYHVANAPEQAQAFDAQHIHLSDLGGKIALEVTRNDSLNLRIRKLHFRERSGFCMENLAADVTHGRQGVAIEELNVRLPKTSLRISRAVLLSPDVKSPVEAPVEVHLEASQVCLKDFAAFAPPLSHFTETLEMTADLSGLIDDLTVDHLNVKHNEQLLLNGQMELKGLRQPEQTYLFGSINQLHLSVDLLTSVLSRLQQKSLALPEQTMQRLTHVNFSGEISGFTDQLTAYGNLHSDVGSIQMDMLIGRKKEENIAFYLKGQASSSELRVSELFGEGNPYGSVRFKAELDASQPVNGSLAGNIQAQVYHLDYLKYRYENILLSGNFGRNTFDGRMDMDDANGEVHIEGSVNSNDKQHPAVRLSARLTDVRPDRLHLTEQYDNPRLSLALAADFTGLHPDRFDGWIAMNDFSFLTRTDTFRLDSLAIRAVDDANGRKLTVSSDLVNVEIGGVYAFASLMPSLLSTGHAYLPSLPLNENCTIRDNAFYLIMTVGNTEALARAFHLPFANIEQGHLSGLYDNAQHRIRVNALLPKFRLGKSVFEYGSVELDNSDGLIRLQAKTAFTNRKKARNILQVQSEASDDNIRTLFSWESNSARTASGIKVDIAASTLFVSENDGRSLRTEITLAPNQLIVRDSVWHMDPASITIVDGKTTIDNIFISKGEQHLRINGAASTKDPKETILLELNDIELSHIFDVVNIRSLQFGGRATGVCSVSNVYGIPAMNADLEVQNFSFNQAVQGRLKLTGEWDNEEEGIQLMGTIYKDATDTIYTDVNGTIYPAGAKEGLTLHFNANDLNLALLHPYVDAFTHVVEGRAFGHVHLFGPFAFVTFEGEALVKDGRIGVDFLHTDYTFSDSIHITPTSFRGDHITVYDKYGNRGVVDFNVQHKYLEDFTYQVDVQAQNLLIYDAPEYINPQIYGTVYGNGIAQVKGNDRLITVDANVQSSAHTNMGFNFINNSSAGQYDFIQFRDALSDDRQPAPSGSPLPSPAAAEETGAEVRVNCMVDVTPDANFELVMDDMSDAKLRGSGSGDIQIQYGSKTSVALYGGYTIHNGSYNFSLQQLIRKDFQIRDGSRLDFRGDPMNANLSMNAIYYLTANIEDLDQSLSKETLRSSIPVNCVLNLNGRLQSPSISFDIELPNSTGELARQVKSFIDTEDMMARQIVYLLALNKFYTPDYSSNDYGSAVASSALSSQLSNILNSLTDKVQIGTNIRSRQDGFTDTEVEMLLSSQLLDNRLLFNGNFGYKNYMIQTNAFIGEFDLEYKLTSSGEVRLKAYNHANDMYRYNMKSLTRQGVGIMLHKDFSSLIEVFRRRKKTFPSTDSIPAGL